MLLEDKVVIVSGIGPGLGQELAYGAVREGASVALAARSADKLDEVARLIGERGGTALTLPTDITDAHACQALVDATVARFGRVDALINSAYRPGEFSQVLDADLADWRATLETNLFGSLNLTRAAANAMKTQQRGAIVMINSMITRKPLPTQGGYAASKGALASVTKILASELGPSGIRVNSVFMGWMWGPPVQAYVQMAAQAAGMTEDEVIGEVTKHIPLGHIPDDADCANPVHG